MTRCLLLAGLLFSGCPKPAPTPVPPTPPAADAGGSPISCLRACEHVHTIGCDTDNGCYAVCRKAKDQALTDCLAQATSCYEVDNCD